MHLTIDRLGRRRVAQVDAPTGTTTGATVDADTIFRFDGVAQALVATGVRPARLEKYAAAGFDPGIVLDPDGLAA